MPPSEASAPGSSGKNRPWSRRCSLSCLRVMPGSTTQSRSCEFTASTRFISRKSIDTPPKGALMWPSSEVPAPNAITGMQWAAQMRTASCTSSVVCGNTTASGGSFAIQVVVLACCSRTACEVTTRLPNFAVSAATAALIAFGSERAVGWDASDISAIGSTYRCWQVSRTAAAPAKRRPAPPADIFELSRLAPERNQHRDPLAVAPVFVPEQRHQIAFLEEDADENVGRRHRREQQMPGRHHRRRPERDHEAEIDRMAHHLVEHRRLEARRGHRSSGQVDDDLMQPEQLEMVDQERAEQDEQPADERQAHHRHGKLRVGDLPDHRRDRAPLPEQQHEREARQQDIG